MKILLNLVAVAIIGLAALVIVAQVIKLYEANPEAFKKAGEVAGQAVEAASGVVIDSHKTVKESIK